MDLHSKDDRMTHIMMSGLVYRIQVDGKLQVRLKDGVDCGAISGDGFPTQRLINSREWMDTGITFP